MKKRFLVCGLVIIALLAGCSPVPRREKAALDTVQKFYRAVEKNDTKALSKMGALGIVSSVAGKGKLKSMTVIVDYPYSNTAQVTVTFENGEKTTILLRGVKGKWEFFQ